MKISTNLILIFKNSNNGQLSLWASSLVYTTLLSFVPLLAISFSTLKLIGVQEQLTDIVNNLVQPLGPEGIVFAQNLMVTVEQFDVSILGSFSLIFLFAVAFSLLAQLEQSFNFIWKIQIKRIFVRRVAIFLIIVSLVPVLLVSLLGLLSSTAIVKIITSAFPSGMHSISVFIVDKLVSYLVPLVMMTIVFYLVPNTKVFFRSAFLGALIASVAWILFGWLFKSFVVGSAHYHVVYASFALPILFLIWLFVSWMLILIGCYFSYCFQSYLMRNSNSQNVDSVIE